MSLSEDYYKFSNTRKLFQGFNNSNLPYKPGTVVTDILIRGGGGTITFSDGVTVEFMFGFIPDNTIPGGGRFGITLTNDRAQLVYQNVLTQNLCDTIDWLLQCSDLARRVALLELNAGIGVEVIFTAADWMAGANSNTIEIPASGALGAGQIGPHNLDIGRVYNIHVWEDNVGPILVGVDVELQVDLTTGLVTLRKAPLAPAFSGRLIIS